MPIYYTDTTIIVKYFLKKKFELKYLIAIFVLRLNVLLLKKYQNT